jgi:Ca2+-binding EF-hand superfamily protein
MNPNRKRCVAQAFKKLDKDGNGWIDINDIRGVYNAQKHPDVTSGKKTEEQILQEFLETFETHHAMRTNDAPNYVVTKEEFEEYYNNISCSIDDDMYFTLMISNAWKLTEESTAGMNQKGWSADHTKARKNTSSNIFNRPEPEAKAPEPKMTATDEVSVKEHIRSKMAKRGPRGIASLGKKFKIADDDRSGELNMEEFTKAMHDFRMELSKEQV